MKGEGAAFPDSDKTRGEQRRGAEGKTGGFVCWHL